MCRRPEGDPRHLLETPGFFKRFLREADLGQAITHENVVRTYDCDALLHDGQQQNFLVMEYVEGQTLRDLLKELDRVPEELCRHIGREVAKGLTAYCIGIAAPAASGSRGRMARCEPAEPPLDPRIVRVGTGPRDDDPTG